MARPSTVDRLPPEAHLIIKRARAAGGTIDEIIAELGDRWGPVSRSALGRHVMKLGTLHQQRGVQQIEEISGSIGRLEASLGELRRELAENGGGLLPAGWTVTSEGAVLSESDQVAAALARLRNEYRRGLTVIMLLFAVGALWLGLGS
jgi:hypothetical protein